MDSDDAYYAQELAQGYESCHAVISLPNTKVRHAHTPKTVVFSIHYLDYGGTSLPRLYELFALPTFE